MLPGTNYVYQCPGCGAHLIRPSLRSGNTFDAELYSDGKQIAPMLPEHPDLTACKQCNYIFWLSKLEEIAEFDWGDADAMEWQAAEEASFPNIDGYFTALENGLAENREEELYIRQRIWWAFNDRVRQGKGLFKDESDETRWRGNCLALIKLLDDARPFHLILHAEIERNLGRFDHCIALISRLEEPDLLWLKEVFLSECEKQNTLVFQLS